MNIYNGIKETLNMEQVVRQYGFEPNRSGFINCPFHNEKTSSMKIYDTSFYCFGCGAGGDVIKFTAMLFKLKNFQAAIKLNNDFFLRLTSVKPDREAEQKYLQEKIRKENEIKKYRAEYFEKCDEFKALRNVLEVSEDFEQRAKAQARLEYLEYWFDENEWR